MNNNQKNVNKMGAFCGFCKTEITFYNNDTQFSWDMHRQDEVHKKKGKVVIQRDMYDDRMEKFFVSGENLEILAQKQLKLAAGQNARYKEFEIVTEAVSEAFSKRSCGKFQVCPFGSRIAGLATRDSADLDLMIDTSEEGEDGARLCKFPELLKSVFSLVVKYMKNEDPNHTFVNVIDVLDCRTPIVKAMHFDTKLQIDITANEFSLLNTNMLRMYMNHISKFRPLLLILREWSVTFECDGVTKIKNYALALLVLFYLQIEKYAPSVDELKYDYNGPIKMICNYECLDYNKVEFDWTTVNSTEDVSLRDLLLGFFEYYSTYDFSNQVICPLMGKLVNKQLFFNCLEKGGKKLPPEMYAYVKQVKHGELFCISNTGMALQDPIDLAHNVTKQMNEKFMLHFCDLSEAAVNVLKHM